MRYKWIELVGYGGIYNGLGLNQIKIDFTKCRYNKIIIRGKNGSGKSTIMNAINPNPDSNSCFIPNTEARKTMSLLCNGVEYIIRYIHPVNGNGNRMTTKGYVSKTINGQLVELNPNGNISSCNDILYEEFGLDSNYISLSKLSSENRGLVDSKPAERKKLINGIINILDTYNGIYKNLSKKSSAYKQIINSLVYKIDHIGDENMVRGNLANIEARINSLEEDKSKAIEASAAIKVKIADYEAILKENNYDSILSELRALDKDIKSLSNNIQKQLQSYGITDISKVDDFLNYINTQITSIQNEVDLYKQIIPEKLAEREAESKDLQNKTEKLNSLQSEYNYLDIKKAMESARAIVNEYNTVFENMGLEHTDLITRDEYDSAMESLNYLLTSSNTLTSMYQIDDIKYVIYHNQEIALQSSDIKFLKDQLDQYKNERSELDKQIAIFQSKREIANELNNRPTGCKIDDCPYIKSAVDANNQYPESELKAMSDRLEILNSSIADITAKIDKYETYSVILTHINSIVRELNSKMKFISKFPLRKDFKETFLYRLAELDPFDDIRECYKYVEYSNILDEYKIAKEQLHTYEVEHKLYESKNSIIESLIESINDITKKTDELAQQIDYLNSQISEREMNLEKLKILKSKVEALSISINQSYKPSVERQNELLILKKSLDSNTSALDELHANLSISDNNIGSISSDIKNLYVERDKLRHNLSLVADYKNELAEYNDKYSKIDKIRYYSSPSTGIQTLFMQLYMNKIITTANDLLSLLFDGEFILQPFIINENEFKIPCLGNGLLHDDISSMSTAQKSMISMILSFSLLRQSSTKYNIVFVDEIDGGLDTGNRAYFITLLDRLMMMLQCEQCFIVSHNSELDMSMADVIVLKSDPGDVYNGNIIWHY
jgi:hypothetical protein